MRKKVSLLHFMNILMKLSKRGYSVLKSEEFVYCLTLYLPRAFHTTENWRNNRDEVSDLDRNIWNYECMHEARYQLLILSLHVHSPWFIKQKVSSSGIWRHVSCFEAWFRNQSQGRVFEHRMISLVPPTGRSLVICDWSRNTMQDFNKSKGR